MNVSLRDTVSGCLQKDEISRLAPFARNDMVGPTRTRRNDPYGNSCRGPTKQGRPSAGVAIRIVPSGSQSDGKVASMTVPIDMRPRPSGSMTWYLTDPLDTGILVARISSHDYSSSPSESSPAASRLRHCSSSTSSRPSLSKAASSSSVGRYVM